MPSWRRIFWVGLATLLVVVVSNAAVLRATDADRSALALMAASPRDSTAFAAASRISGDIWPFDTAAILVEVGAVLVLLTVVVIALLKMVWPVRPIGEQRGFEVIR